MDSPWRCDSQNMNQANFDDFVFLLNMVVSSITIQRMCRVMLANSGGACKNSWTKLGDELKVAYYCF